MKSFLQVLFIAFAFIIGTASCQNEVAQIINAASHAVPVANAGPSKTVQLPLNSDTLRGTASSANGPVIGYLWSLVSGPNNPTIVSPSSKTTVINSLVAGNYIFQFAVIDSAGYTGVDTVSVRVVPSVAPVPQTLILQPTNNPTEVHLGLLGSSDITNAATPEFTAAAWTSGGIPFTLRSIFKFNLSTIPVNATILSAKLTLYTNPTPLNGDHINSNSGINNAMYLERNTSNWNATVTWQTQPSSDTASQIFIPHTSLNFLDLIDIDVKNMVATMVSTNNYGFKIRLQNEVIYTIRNFSSSRYSDSTKHPKLVIVYQ
jgi:hypothetical protein